MQRLPLWHTSTHLRTEYYSPLQYKIFDQWALKNKTRTLCFEKLTIPGSFKSFLQIHELPHPSRNFGYLQQIYTFSVFIEELKKSIIEESYEFVACFIGKVW